MAKKIVIPSKVVVEIAKMPKQKTETKESFLDKISKYLPAIPLVGVFTVLCYFLGRLHIEAYYYALGINPNVLSFNTNDYMFSSFNLVVMCIVISICLYVYWLSFKERVIVRGTNVILLFIFMVLFWVYFFIVINNADYYVIGLSGLIVGFCYGSAILFSIVIGQYVGQKTNKDSVDKSSESKKKPEQKTEKPSRKPIISAIVVIFVVIYIFAMMPIITENLAKTQAQSDKAKFPYVTVVCTENLTIQTQNSSHKLTNIVNGKLVITNNAITYVLQSDNSTYAIPVTRIIEILYISENKSTS